MEKSTNINHSDALTSVKRNKIPKFVLPSINEIREDTSILDTIVGDFTTSDFYKGVLRSEKYYLNQNTFIKSKKRGFFDSKDNRMVEDKISPNTMIAHGDHRDAIQKTTDYIKSADFQLKFKREIGDEERQELIDEIDEVVRNTEGNNLDAHNRMMFDTFQKQIIGWTYVWITQEEAYEKGEFVDKVKFNFKVEDSKRIIPIWEDEEKLKLEKVIRIIQKKEWSSEKQEMVDVDYYEVHDKKGRETFKKIDGGTTEYVGRSPHFQKVVQANGRVVEEGDEIKWHMPPFIPILENEDWQNPLDRYKTMIDQKDLTMSAWSDDLQQYNEMLLVLSDGQSTAGANSSDAETLQRLHEGGLVRLSAEGKMEKIDNEIPTEAKEKFVDKISDAIKKEGHTIETTPKENLNYAHTPVFKFLFADLDSKVDRYSKGIETYMKNLLIFLDIYRQFIGEKSIYNVIDGVEVIVKRKVVVNEMELANMVITLVKNKVISMETARELLPFITNSELEKMRVMQEEEEALAISGGGSMGVNPVPTPTEGESQEDFIARFMADAQMIAEFPDETQRQQMAQSTWTEAQNEEA